MVNFNVVKAWSGMVADPKALVMVGAATPTVRLADAVLPLPPFVELTVTLLFFTPVVVPWTLTETVQLAFGARLAPERLTVEEPAVAVAVPPHVLFRLEGVATTKPAGRLSVNATPVSVRF